jgi:hypothetical protein
VHEKVCKNAYLFKVTPPNVCGFFKNKADVAEVVRCKDCGYYENGKDYAPYCNNVMNLFEEMKPTDFCSYGERREDNG